MPVPKTDALPLGYTPYGLFWTVERGEGEGGSRARRTSRAVQGRGDIASKQKGSPFRTDYNKLTTLIERKGKLSALFACNAISKLANASVTLDSLRCSTELVGSTSTESR